MLGTRSRVLRCLRSTPQGYNLELSSVSDEQLAELFSTAPIIHHYGAVKIVRLSKTLALKGGRGVAPSEARNMKFVTENLSLSAPKVYRDFAADVPGPFDEGSGVLGVPRSWSTLCNPGLLIYRQDLLVRQEIYVLKVHGSLKMVPVHFQL
ncbi:hypothetical protein M7I_7668 [Glarea lozoyensis 74030]|uniref:Uncharacterized protein n=1 Tax=Glarea lozoyensis (strain ATCC 74030 / MF5533) TaxID=1104152 RepID=H0EXX5_GLAL7|nr:hypothetical protein M7I_7668 [Glarea lozoyensis 74030]